MSMASLNASLLARKGSAFPAAQAPRHLASVPQPTGHKTKSKATYAKEAKTKKKHFRLGDKTDRDLRLLSVREGLSQQALIEKAIQTYLDVAFQNGECICRGND